MIVNDNEFLWVEKFRPQVVNDCVLPDRIKTPFLGQVSNGAIQNMLLVGGPGTGKTTVARALCNELGVDILFVNASENGNIDTLRTTIRSFAGTLSFNGKPKCVILDEADSMTSATQTALRGFIEEFSNNCRFILTANFGNKIIEPIKSRCSVIDFLFTREEKKGMIIEFDKRARFILSHENVEYDKADLAQIIIKYFPDFRKVINELQRNSGSGNLNSGGLVALSENSIVELVGILKKKDFASARKWIVDNLDNDFAVVQRALYDRMYEYISPASIPQLILLLASYDYKNAFVIDKEINLAALFIEIMADVEFK